MRLPPQTLLRRDNTHRLIPSRYAEGDAGVLGGLASDNTQLERLVELEGATNDRLLGESGLLPGISVHELVYGVSYAHIVNAAFTHARPLGSRFNDPDRGAWYASFAMDTACREVAYHKAEELREIDWQEEEVCDFVDYEADFRCEFVDLREVRGFAACLSPVSYDASQALGRQLLAEGGAGIVYPSVRHSGGTCLACFRPALVSNVRQGANVAITFADAWTRPKIEISRTR
jgi:RES domain-containing protein